jgi:hypothetical protein
MREGEGFKEIIIFYIMKMKKKKKYNNLKYQELLYSIKKYSNYVPLYNIFFENHNRLETNSIFNMYNYNVSEHINYCYEFKNDLDFDEKKIIACKKIILEPSEEQKNKLLNMLEGYRLVYNKTIKFFKERRYNYIHEPKTKVIEITENIKSKAKKQKKNSEKSEVEIEKDVIFTVNKILRNICKEEDKEKRIEKVDKLKQNNNIITDEKIIRTYFLKKDIDRISKEYKTPVHCLDYAVKLACSSYKSALENLKLGNIKHFNLSYIKKTKKSLMMDIEKAAIKSNTIYPSLMGKILKNRENLEYSNIFDCKIHYNSYKKQFTLLVPIEKDKNIIENNNWICIDPGIRKFLNCKTNNGFIEIGKNLSNKIKSKIMLIDKQDKIKDVNLTDKLKAKISNISDYIEEKNVK